MFKLQDNISSNVKVELFDSLGNLKDTRETHNAVHANAKNGTADQLLAAPSLNKPTHTAIGTGTHTPPANLGTELDRNAFTSKTRSTNVVTTITDWAAGDGTGAITEAGIFDAAAAGNVWLSTTFSVVNKGALDTLKITWTITVN